MTRRDIESIEVCAFIIVGLTSAVVVVITIALIGAAFGWWPA